MNESVCLFLSVCSQTTRPNFTKFSTHVIRGGGSVRFSRRRNILCTSGFEDDVLFSHNGPYGVRHWQYSYVSAMLEQVVINFQRLRQGAPHCLTLAVYVE